MGLNMKVVAALVAVLACGAAVGAQNVVCKKGKISKAATMEYGGKVLSFKTQKKKKYAPNTDCTVEYKMGSTCAKISFACGKGKKRCGKGDTLTVTANGKDKDFCKIKNPKVKCKVKCTEKASTTGILISGGAPGFISGKSVEVF